MAGVGLIFVTENGEYLCMLAIIIIITISAIAILCIGFLEVRIPFLSIPERSYRKKLSKHDRKMLHKRIWYHHIHEGFVKLPTGSYEGSS